MSANLLGGATQTCSASRVRRLFLGELGGEERAQLEAHLGSCARCQAVQREMDRESAALRAAMPFEEFAAGVAEKLAGAAKPAGRPEALGPRRSVRRAGQDRGAGLLGSLGRLGGGRGMAMAAGVAALALGSWVALRTPGVAPDPWQRNQTKGGASMRVFALREGKPILLDAGEKVREGEPLLVSIEPGPHAFAAVALVEGGSVSSLYDGPAKPGPLPHAFEWTGAAPSAEIAVLYSNAPIDTELFANQLALGTFKPPRDAELLRRPLERAEQKEK